MGETSKRLKTVLLTQLTLGQTCHLFLDGCVELAYLVSIETSGWFFSSKEECCGVLDAAGLKWALMEGWMGFRLGFHFWGASWKPSLYILITNTTLSLIYSKPVSYFLKSTYQSHTINLSDSCRETLPHP